MADREQFTRHSVEVDFNEADYNVLRANGSFAIKLNFDSQKSVILGDVNDEQAFQCVLASKKDCSLVVGFSSKPHALCKDFTYMNSIVNGVKIYEEKSHVQVPPVVNKPEIGDSTNSTLPPKKAFGPKLIQLAVFLAIGIAILLILPKRCKSHTSGNFQSTSTSGDSIKKDMQLIPSNSFPTKTKKK